MSQKYVALFQDFIPPYRKEFLEKVSKMLNGRLFVFVNSDMPIEYNSIDVCADSFIAKKQKRIIFKIPGLKRKISFQIGVLFVLFSRRFFSLVLPLQLTRLEVWFALFFNIILRKRVLLWGQAIHPESKWFSRQLRLLFMKLASGVIFYTNTRRQFAVNCGFSEQKAFVAQNTVSTDEMIKVKNSIPKRECDEFLCKNNLLGRNVIVYLGRLLYDKRPDLLLRALPEILPVVPDALLLFIGDGVALSQLKTMANELCVSEHVRFVGRVFDNKLLSFYLRSSKIAVIPSRAGLTIHHAFLYGVPIITEDDRSSWAPEAELINNDTGAFFKSGDSADLAVTIIDLLSNPERLEKMSHACETLMSQVYTSDKMASGFVNAIFNKHNCD